MKRYSENELLEMSEAKMNSLFEAGKMDDDDAQHWHDLRDEGDYLAEQFLKYELGAWI